MKNTQITSLGIITSGLLLASPIYAEKNEESLPNVIFVLADDLGIGDLGCYGQRQIRTPHIDALAKEGMLFTQHYSGSTVSAPSRCSLMTGKHTGNTYIRGNYGVKGNDGRRYDLPLPTEEITVAELLKQKDYQTACIGKWGMGGPESTGHPNNQGFDYFFGYLGQGNAHFFYPDILFENSTPIQLNKKVYAHDMIMDKAFNFIENNVENPFFIYLTPTIPHAELVVPEGEMYHYDGKFDEKPYVGKHYCSQEKPRATFAAMVTRLDQGMGELVKLLKEKNIFDNTIIIFTSDNGTHVEGGHNPYYFDSNGPFRGVKRDLYEGGIRTPFIVSWPNTITPDSKTYHVSAFWDLMPTLCDIIDIKTPKASDGISYLPTLTGEGRQKQHDYLYYEFHEGAGKQAVIQDGWKLIYLQVNKPDKARYELYNIAHDPNEIADVYKQYPDKAKALKKIMQKARSENKHWKFKFEKNNS